MIEIVKAISSGIYTKEAAATLMADRFGLSYEDAMKQIGDVKDLSGNAAKVEVVSGLI